MHVSAFLKAQYFIKHYRDTFLKSPDGKTRVLEVGSKSYSEQDTYRPLFGDGFEYTGLDVEAGPNVDIVTKGYVWSEIADDSFDLVVSGQTFEHNPFFWVTFGEMARIVRPGGCIFITAPGAGPVHRFPYDCWRFYPDSWRALAALTGVEVVETYYEPDDVAALVPGGFFRDSVLVARVPDGAAGAGLNDRMRALSAPYAERSFNVTAVDDTLGPCFAEYEAEALRRYKISARKALSRRLRKIVPLHIFMRGQR